MTGRTKAFPARRFSSGSLPELPVAGGEVFRRIFVVSLLFYGKEPVRGLVGRAGRGKLCRTVLLPDAESPDLPRVGCFLSVSVSCRTRSRRPPVFRPLPENRYKGRAGKRWRSVVPGLFLILPSLQAQCLLWAPSGFVCGKPHRCFLPPSFTKDKASLNAPGPPASIQAAGPGAVSSRNLLAALSVTASVQALQSVQCVQRRRAVVLRGRRCRPRALSSGRAARAAQAEFTSAVSKARSVQALQSVQCVQNRRAFAQLGRRQCHRRNSLPP